MRASGSRSSSRSRTERRNDLAALSALTVAGAGGRLVPLSEIGRFEPQPEETSIYHKNLKPVVYVTADVAGAKEAPVYAILALEKGLSRDPRPRRVPDRDANGDRAVRLRPVTASSGTASGT